MIKKFRPPLLCNKGTTHKTSILRDKQEDGFLLHITIVMGYPSPILIILEDGVVIL
jgi:hypothetical protein